MTFEVYVNSDEIHGWDTENHLQGTGWFYLLSREDPEYQRARRAAEKLARVSVNPRVRFFVLKAEYDNGARRTPTEE